MKPHGELRQSQVVGTFGPGAMLDLPNHSVLVAGLEQWQGQGIEIHEPRLVRKIQTILNIQSLKLYGPPINVGGLDGAGPTPGIRCYVFPEWFVTQDDMDEEHGGKRSRAMIPADALVSGKWIDSNRKKRVWCPFVLFVDAVKAILATSVGTRWCTGARNRARKFRTACIWMNRAPAAI